MSKELREKIVNALLRFEHDLNKLIPKIDEHFDNLTPPNKEELQAEIIKELREFYPTKTRQYEIKFSNKKYYIGDDKFNSGIYIVKLEQLTLTLTSKIIKFFELEEK